LLQRGATGRDEALVRKFRLPISPGFCNRETRTGNQVLEEDGVYRENWNLRDVNDLVEVLEDSWEGATRLNEDDSAYFPFCLRIRRGKIQMRELRRASREMVSVTGMRYHSCTESFNSKFACELYSHLDFLMRRLSIVRTMTLRSAKTHL
jgi:hypothetical protein